jgi:hypothetical protein
MSRAGPLLLLLLLPLIVFADVLTGDRALIGVHTDQLSPWRAETPADRLQQLEERFEPLAADKTLMFQPQLAVASERLLRGEAPLWNPDNLCGVPLLAQAVHGVLHPPNLLTFWLPFAVAWGWIALLQTVMAGLFVYALARELGTGRWPAALSGISFAFCGYLAVRFQWFQIHGASIYVPLALLAIERLFRGTGRWGATAALALAVGLSFLAGFPQASLHLLYVAALLSAWHLATGWRAGGDVRRRALGAASRAGLGAVLGLALGMPQLGPAVELAGSPESTRRAVSPELAATLAMRPVSLGGALIPDLFGHPRDLRRHAVPHLQHAGALRRLLQKPHANYVETACTIGLAPLVLALLGLAGRRRGRGLAALLFLGGALLAIDTPLLPAVLHLPGLSTGDPRRFLLLMALGGALLSGLGLARVLEGGLSAGFVRSVCGATTLAVIAAAVAFAIDASTWARLVVPPLAAVAGVGEAEVAALSGDLALDLSLLQAALLRFALLAVSLSGALLVAQRRPVAGVVLLMALAVVDLAGFARRSHSALPADGFFDEPPSLAALSDDRGGRLVRFVSGDVLDPLAYPLPPNTGLPFGVRDLSGYITLAPRRVEALHELLEAGSTFGVGTAALHDPASLESPLLDLFAVTGVLSDVELQAPGLVPAGRVGAAWLYRREPPPPRAWLATEVRWVADEPAAGRALADALGGPRRMAVVEGPASAFVGAADEGPVGEARLVRDEAELVQLEVDARREALLVLADSYMPGWEARIDGEPATILPTNLAFRGVIVPAGRHTVTFRYRSPMWSAGLVIGVLGLLGLLACAAAARRRPLPASPSATSAANAERRPSHQ